MGQATFPDALDALITLGKAQGADWGDMIEALQRAAEGLDAEFDDLVLLRHVAGLWPPVVGNQAESQMVLLRFAGLWPPGAGQ